MQDGGSTDESAAVLKEYSPRLKHWESRRDNGQAHAINIGFQHAAGDPDAALESLEAASDVFDDRTRVGDHVPHLLDRLSRLAWPAHVSSRIDAWRTLLHDRSRRNTE